MTMEKLFIPYELAVIAKEKEWRPIIGYEGRYEVSNTGEIRSLNYNNKKGIIKNLTPSISNAGYYMLPLRNNGKQKTFCVHFLVAKHFIEKPKINKRLSINHKDGNKLSNSVDNLEWVTYSSNMKHAVSSGLWKPYGKGKKYAECKLSKRVGGFINNKLILQFASLTEARDKGGLFISNISKAIKNNKKYKGYEWRFI